MANRLVLRYEKALLFTPEKHPDRAGRLQSVANKYYLRYQKKRDGADTESAIKRLQEALNLTPEDHADLADRLQALGMRYGDRYRVTGAIEDLDTAIQRLHEAAGKTVDLLQRAYQLEDLAYLYKSRFERTGAMASLDRSISFFKEILETVSDSNPAYPYWLYSLAVAYERKSTKTGAMGYLEQSIQLGQESLSKTPEDDPERVIRLMSLASGYEFRFLRIEAIADLSQAIQLREDALKKTAENDTSWHGLRSENIMSLIYSYEIQFGRTQSTTDSDRLSQLIKEVLDEKPDGPPDRASRLENYNRCMKIKAILDGDQSIRIHEPLEETLENPIHQAYQLRGLAEAYMVKFSETGATTDFEKSVKFSQQALEKIPEDHQERAFHLRTLADICVLDKSRKLASSDAAIQLYKQALDKTQEDDTQQSFLLLSLAMTHMGQFIKAGAPIDLEQATQIFHRLLNFSPCLVRNRILAGKCLVELYARINDWSQAYEVASQTLSLIPLFTPRFLQTSDMQHLLVEILHLGSDAAAISLMIGKEPFEAIRLLELGRGIIAGTHYDMYTDIPDLRQQYPQIAKEYIDLRDQLNTSKSTECSSQRYNISQELEQKIQAIRRIAGFDQFLSTQSKSELKSIAEMGPIVLINVSDYRCDALIIDKREFRSLLLPCLNVVDIRARAAALGSSELNTQLLEWLWDTIAGPVLEALGFTERPSGRWPRLWWIPTGPLVKFPIHAAGYHAHGFDTVLDRVISSYCISSKALSQSRHGKPQTKFTTEPEEAVLVGMKRTPGYSHLPLVLQEIDKLDDICKSMGLKVARPQTCVNEVLSAVNNCKIFHFAGHGRPHLLDPSRSALFLSDNELTVADLLELKLHHRKPFLAYLSACGTGQITNDGLLDEGLHLIGACQLAGFQHVIGTLWIVSDEVSVNMATMVYEWMRCRGISDDSVSEGLHHASRRLRTQWVEDNATRGGSQSGKVVFMNGQLLGREQSCSGQRVLKTSRDIVSCDDTPLYWIPFVHFGI